MSENQDSHDEFFTEIDVSRLASIVSPPVTIAKDGLTNFRWREDGLQINTVDSANAIVVTQNVLPSAFIEYDMTLDVDEFVFGARCKTISNLLKAASVGDTASLYVNAETNQMKIQFSDVSYLLSGVAPDGVDEPHMPELEYDVKAKVNHHVFKRADQVIGMISDTINFEVGDGTFKISGKGDTDVAEVIVNRVSDEGTLQYNMNEAAAMILDSEDTANAKYSSELIHYVNQFTPDTNFEIYFGEDYPLRVEVGRNDGDIPTEIIVAPRMDSS